MSTNNTDPFSSNNSPFSKRTRTPDPATPVSKPQLPGLPGLPKPAPVTPPEPAQQDFDTPEGLSEPTPVSGGEVTVPKLPVFPNKPSFKPLNPARGTVDELFPVAPETDDEEIISTDEDDEEYEETVEDIYKEIYGEDVDPKMLTVNLTDEELLDVEKKMDALSDPAALPTLYALADDEDWSTRAFVASNPHTPESLLARLATDEESMVRQNVMENPNISDELYRSFAKDKDEDVIVDWLEFHRTTPDMITVLFNTTNDFVASVMLELPTVPSSIKAALKQKLSL